MSKANELKYQKRFQQEYVSQSLNKHGLSLIDKYTEKLNKLIESEPFMNLLDKFSFVCGVLLLIVTVHILSSYSSITPYYYLVIIAPLLVARYFIYKKNKWHYFMIDFCYFCNLLMVTSILTDHPSPLFQVCFVFSHGPLLMAIPMWRNSLVFHDLDRMTSVCIHTFPALVSYIVRWNIMENAPSISFFSGFILPALLYIVWQVGYLIITEGFKKETIQKNHYITSLIWLSQEHPHPIYLYLLKKGFKDRPLIILISVQFIYTLLTIVPTFIYYHCKFLNFAWIVFCTIWAICNGANFYFEVFIKSYAKRVDKSVKELKKSEKKENNNNNENIENDDDMNQNLSDTSDYE